VPLGIPRKQKIPETERAAGFQEGIAASIKIAQLFIQQQLRSRKCQVSYVSAKTV
jgi:hypothetical protein